MPLPVLDALEQRVLGSLLEKQVTVPASYPLTLNALRQACNQTSSREPVMDLDDKTLIEVLKGLKDRSLVTVALEGAGSRTLKYRHSLDEVIPRHARERALLTVLLLRGAQSAGELKTRTERLHAFASKDDVTAALMAMAAASSPLVAELPLARGHQDVRWMHLLDAALGEEAEEPESVVDREVVLDEGAQARDARVVAAYDAIALPYAEATADVLSRRPFDRWMLERVAADAEGPVMDLGCGPGHLSAFLASRGAHVHGLDASPAMVAQARARYPDLEVEVGRFQQLMRPRDASAWGAIVAWHSFVHLAPSELVGVLRTAGATLRPGGRLALALEAGSELVHHDRLFDTAVDLDVVQHGFDEVLAAAAEAGLAVDEWYVRSSLPGESPAHRFYVLAHRPA